MRTASTSCREIDQTAVSPHSIPMDRVDCFSAPKSFYEIGAAAPTDNAGLDAEKIRRCVAIPQQGVLPILFPNGQNYDLIASISMPRFQDHVGMAEIEITLVDGSEHRLMFMTSIPGVYAGGDKRTLDEQVYAFYQMAAANAEFGEVEMRKQFDLTQSQIETLDEAPYFAAAGIIGGFAFARGFLLFTEAGEAGAGFGWPGFLIVGGTLLVSAFIFLPEDDSDISPEVKKLCRERGEYFKNFKTVDDYVKAVNSDPELKSKLATLWWVQSHQKL